MAALRSSRSVPLGLILALTACPGGEVVEASAGDEVGMDSETADTTESDSTDTTESDSTDTSESESAETESESAETESESAETESAETESESESAETESESAETESESTETTETETETGGGEPSCGDWTSVKTRAYGLERVWTDGLDIVSAGMGDVVTQGEGVWTNVEAVDASSLNILGDVWGPSAADHWWFGNPNPFEARVYRVVDGVFETSLVIDPGDHDYWAEDLAGSGPDDLWAVAAPYCDTLACGEDPNCACHQAPSQLHHFDGQGWSAVAAPGEVHGLWTDGTSTYAVGGQDHSAAVSATTGFVAERSGDTWQTILDGDLPALTSAWGTGTGELWVAGAHGALRGLDQGAWTTHDLPSQAELRKVEGRSSAEVWALDEDGQFYAYDGQQWSPWLLVAQAADFAVLDDGLVAVGEEGGHWIAHLDTETDAITPLYTLDGTHWPQTLVADGPDLALASNGGGWSPLAPLTPSSRRYDGQGWSPTFAEFADVGGGFDYLRGTPELAWGVRRVEADFEPDADIVYAVEGETVTPVSAPAPGLTVNAAGLVSMGGQDQLWIGGRTFGDLSQNFVYARVGEQWEDRTPVGFGNPLHITSAGERVFLAEMFDTVWVFEAGQWSELAVPPALSSLITGMAAAGPEELWVVGSLGGGGHGLFHWDGVDWQAAADEHPALASSEDWWAVAAHGPDDVWMLSSDFNQPEVLAHYDGADWAIVETPALLHGWNERQRVLLEPTDGALFIHDGIRLWRRAACEP